MQNLKNPNEQIFVKKTAESLNLWQFFCRFVLANAFAIGKSYLVRHQVEIANPHFWPLLHRKCIKLEHRTITTVIHGENPSQPCTACAKSNGSTRIMVKATRSSDELVATKRAKQTKVRRFSNLSRC